MTTARHVDLAAGAARTAAELVGQRISEAMESAGETEQARHQSRPLLLSYRTPLCHPLIARRFLTMREGYFFRFPTNAALFVRHSRSQRRPTIVTSMAPRVTSALHRCSW
jgi:hypothetical protein